MILNRNMFVETRFPTRTIRDVTEEEMDVYLRPYLAAGEVRCPTLTWARNCSGRWRACLCCRCGRQKCCVFAHNTECQSVHTWRPWGIDPGRAYRVLSQSTQHARGGCPRNPLHPGRQSCANRPGRCGVGAGPGRKEVVVWNTHEGCRPHKGRLGRERHVPVVMPKCDNSPAQMNLRRWECRESIQLKHADT